MEPAPQTGNQSIFRNPGVLLPLAVCGDTGDQVYHVHGDLNPLVTPQPSPIHRRSLNDGMKSWGIKAVPRGLVQFFGWGRGVSVIFLGQQVTLRQTHHKTGGKVSWDCE